MRSLKPSVVSPMVFSDLFIIAMAYKNDSSDIDIRCGISNRVVEANSSRSAEARLRYQTYVERYHGFSDH
jgi:hypothetical protein